MKKKLSDLRKVLYSDFASNIEIDDSLTPKQKENYKRELIKELQSCSDYWDFEELMSGRGYSADEINTTLFNILLNL